MEKSVLEQYVDACELIKETERELEKIRNRRREITTDKVKGSSYDFPFRMISYTIHGIPDGDDEKLKDQEHILEERKTAAEAIKLQVEEWMNTIPQRKQRIVRYKIFEKMTWEQVAARMGRKATADSIKKEFQRFMAEK